MVFDPLSFLELANTLSADVNYEDEAVYRTSTGRAYYAAYLICRRYLEINGDAISGTTTHKEVIDKIRGKNPHVGSLLYRLRRNRNEADYDVGTPYRKGFAISSIKLAQIIVDKIDNFT